MFLELKRPGEEPTKLQRQELADLTKAGMTATWADSFEKAKEIIDKHFFAHTYIPVDPSTLI